MNTANERSGSGRHHAHRSRPHHSVMDETAEQRNGDKLTPRQRRFGRGEIKGLILNHLASGPAHGYEVIKAIGELVGDDYQPSPGVIYPTLAALEAAGFISSAQGDEDTDGRKAFLLTSAGEQHLQKHQPQLTELFARFKRRDGKKNIQSIPPLHEAMENLKQALRDQFGSGSQDDDNIKRVAAILTQAAADIRHQP